MNMWICRGLEAVMVLLALAAALVFAGLQMGERKRALSALSDTDARALHLYLTRLSRP